MKNEIFNKSLTRLLLTAFMALVGIGGLCQNPYHTNPNLRLLVGDTANRVTHNFSSVVSSDGERVYYLSVSIDDWSEFYDEQVGSIYSAKIDGSSVQEVLYGKYNNLAISSDGGKLACQSYKEDNFLLIPESLIVVVHLATGYIESLEISSRDRIRKLVWNSSGDYLYYLAANAISRLYLPDSTE